MSSSARYAAESLFQRRLADHVAQHPPHTHRFAAVKFFVGCVDQRPVHFILGSWRGSWLLVFSRGQRGAVQSHVIERRGSSIHMFQIKCLSEVGKALVDPGTRRGKSCVSQLMRSRQSCQFRIGAGQRREQQRPTFKRRRICVGQIGGFHLCPRHSKPFGDERNHFFRGVSIGCRRHVVAMEIIKFDGRSVYQLESWPSRMSARQAPSAGRCNPR